MAPPRLASEELLEQAVDRIWETVPPVWHKMRANVRGIARDRFGISVQQFRVLRHVGRGVRSASEIASLSQMSRPAVSQCVDALVAKGLITRHPSATDRRCIELEVTPQGREMLEAIFGESRRWMLKQLATVDPELIGHILPAMQALKDAFAA
jgi:DNA-binding MarR family transcriptional regulator